MMTVWTGRTTLSDALAKKGNSRLFLLRRLRSFGVQGTTPQTFYDSVVFYGIVCWASSITGQTGQDENGQTVKHVCGSSVMVWGCFAASGPGQLTVIDGIMNSGVYQKILKDNVRPSVRALKLKRSWIMQQDNDPKHTSKSTSEWLKKNKMKVLEWPSQSPDLNPIEMLWSDLKRAVHARRPSNMADLKRFCKEESGPKSLHSVVKDSSQIIANNCARTKFKEAIPAALNDIHGEDIDSLTHCLTDYINFCVENTVPTRTVRSFSNSKPWITPDIKALLKEKRGAFVPGNKEDDQEREKQLQEEDGEPVATEQHQWCLKGTQDHLRLQGAQAQPVGHQRWANYACIRPSPGPVSFAATPVPITVCAHCPLLPPVPPPPLLRPSAHTFCRVPFPPINPPLLQPVSHSTPAETVPAQEAEVFWSAGTTLLRTFYDSVVASAISHSFLGQQHHGHGQEENGQTGHFGTALGSSFTVTGCSIHDQEPHTSLWEVTKNPIVTLSELQRTSVERGEPSRRTNISVAIHQSGLYVKHGGGGSIMLWGCFSVAGTGRLVRIEGKMNAAMYRDILDENLLLQSALDLRLGRRQFIFQQDNDPNHTAKITKEWLQDNSVNVLEWPSQSPDLNPIEHLWRDLKMASTPLAQTYKEFEIVVTCSMQPVLARNCSSSFNIAVGLLAAYLTSFVVFTTVLKGCPVLDAIMLIKTKINTEQKYVKISEPSLDEFLNSVHWLMLKPVHRWKYQHAVLMTQSSWMRTAALPENDRSWIAKAKQVVESALTKKPVGDRIMKEYIQTKGLTDSSRRQMVNILAADMTEIHGGSGYLAWRLKTIQRKSVISEGRRSPRQLRGGGPKARGEASFSPEVALSEEQCREAMSFMKHSTDEAAIKQKMKLTFEFRCKMVLDGEKSSEVLTEFPRFKDIRGLIEQDFILLFGEEIAAKFLERWPTTFKQKVIQQSKALPTSSDLEELIHCAEAPSYEEEMDDDTLASGSDGTVISLLFSSSYTCDSSFCPRQEKTRQDTSSSSSWGDPEAFPGQLRDIVSLQRVLGSSPGPPPSGTCLEHLPREAPRRQIQGASETEQMPAQASGPQLTPPGKSDPMDPIAEHSPQNTTGEGHGGRMPSPDRQSTCGLDIGQTPINPQAPCMESIELVQCSTTGTKPQALFLLNPRVDYWPNQILSSTLA
ncbi:hypothetical protein L3Q82_015687 [Scortum barcoo]|uniref:Uncharacterized protein n=1 Tax=Scortum barcoo TaxID=214431 RepID=A0ACB8VNG8_9TELE|nr:hypothetical protein L3Q82_015687 [Scortum barcoo]